MREIRAMVVVVLLGAALAAQTPGPSLTGVVTRGGQPAADVAVRITRAGAATATVVTTDASGRYRATGLSQGVYRVEFVAPGLDPVVRTGIVLLAGQDTELSVSLAAASIFAFADVWSALRPGEVGVRLETPYGSIFLAIDTTRAPVTSANFLKYVDGGFYDGGRFHRATRPDNYKPAPPDRPMMEIIQGGIDPSKRANGFPPIPLERTSLTGLRHVRGTVSMARGAADSATSDFFILLDDQPSLDFGGRRFDDGQGGAAFGRVLAGLDVVRQIQQQPVQGQNLTPPVPIIRASRR